MKKMSFSDAHELLLEKSPEFIGLIQDAQTKKQEIIGLHIVAFDNEPELMYAAVLYGTTKGFDITFFHDAFEHPFNHPLKKEKK